MRQQTLGVFIGGRVVIGFGISFALAAAPVLLSELAHPRHRVFFVAMFNCSVSPLDPQEIVPFLK